MFSRSFCLYLSPKCLARLEVRTEVSGQFVTNFMDPKCPVPFETLLNLRTMLMYLFECCADWEEVETIYGNSRPLNDDKRRVIDSNRCVLTTLIEPKQSFINRLCAKGCFNEKHKEHIEYGDKTSDKVDRLLDIVRRRSVAHFNKLVEELYRDDQPQLAKLLAEGGGKITSFALAFV